MSNQEFIEVVRKRVKEIEREEFKQKLKSNYFLNKKVKENE